MRVYLSTPGNQLHAHVAADAGAPVLVSYVARSNVRMEQWAPVWDRLLIDSGAYSELTKPDMPPVDLGAYAAFCEDFPYADAFAGLDDIRGDWRLSMRRYREFERGFPTFHPGSDPPELLDELIPMARERGGWIGVGVVPNDNGSRAGQSHTVAEALDRMPAELHVHGFALQLYSHVSRGRLDSVDSTTWWRKAMGLRQALPFLSYAEALQLEVKRAMRSGRRRATDPSAHPTLDFGGGL